MLGMWWAELLNIIAGTLSSGAAAIPVSPVAGYQVWLDANDAATLTFSSGVVVSKWTDKSANAYEFTNSTVANQPSANGSQNSKTTIVFDGSNDKLVSTTVSSTWKFLQGASSATSSVFIAHKKTSTGFGIILGTTQTSAGNVGFVVSNDDSLLNVRTTNGSIAVLADSTISGTPFVITTVISDQSNATVSSKMNNYKNTDSPTVSTLSSGSTFTPSTSNPYANLSLGGLDYFTGTQIGEIIIYNSILSTGDRNANITYLMNKWGL